MQKLPNMTDDERAYLAMTRGLTTDREGREIFVGLDRSESEWMHAYLQNETRPFGERDEDLHDLADRFIEIHDKHELVRIAIVLAEGEVRDVSTRH